MSPSVLPHHNNNTLAYDNMWRNEIYAILAGLLGGARYGVKIRLPHALVMTSLFRKDLTSRGKLRQILRMTLEHASHLAAFATIYKTVLALLKFTTRHFQETNHVGRSQAAAKTNNGQLPGKGLPLLRCILNLIVHGSIIPHGERNTPTTTIPTSTSSSSSFGNALPGYPERLHHSFIAGAVGGFLVWGQYSSVNYQIILYLMSRVLVAAVKRLVMMADPSHQQQQQQQQPSRLSRLVQSNMSYRLVATVVWGMVMVLFEESPQLLHPSLKSSMEEIYRFRLSSSTSSSSSSLNGHHKTSLTI